MRPDGPFTRLVVLFDDADDVIDHCLVGVFKKDAPVDRLLFLHAARVEEQWYLKGD